MKHRTFHDIAILKDYTASKQLMFSFLKFPKNNQQKTSAIRLTSERLKNQILLQCIVILSPQDSKNTAFLPIFSSAISMTKAFCWLFLQNFKKKVSTTFYDIAQNCIFIYRAYKNHIPWQKHKNSTMALVPPILKISIFNILSK